MRVEGDSIGQPAHLARTQRTGGINQPSSSAKSQVAAEALAFHNAARVSMISPCV